MQLHDLQPKSHNKTSKKRLGRGGQYGKTSGRGHKGQKARAGSGPRPQIRDRIKKIPKLRGYQFNPVSEKPAVINVGKLSEYVVADDIVTPRFLVRAGAIKKRGGQIPDVKILGDGEIDVAVTVTKCATSESAREKIEKADGEVK